MFHIHSMIHSNYGYHTVYIGPRARLPDYASIILRIIAAIKGVSSPKKHFFYLAGNSKTIPPLTFFLVPKDCSQRELSNGLFSSGLGGTKAEIGLGHLKFL